MKIKSLGSKYSPFGLYNPLETKLNVLKDYKEQCKNKTSNDKKQQHQQTEKNWANPLRINQSLNPLQKNKNTKQY